MMEDEFIRGNIEWYRRMLQTQSDADLWWAIQKMLDEFETGTGRRRVETSAVRDQSLTTSTRSSQATQPRENKMGSLFFRCPVTHVEFASGIAIDAHSVSQLRDLPVLAFCPACQRRHGFRVKDGTVEPFRFAQLRPDNTSEPSTQTSVRRKPMVVR